MIRDTYRMIRYESEEQWYRSYLCIACSVNRRNHSDTGIVSDCKYFQFLIWAIGVVISLKSCICPRKSPVPSFTKPFRTLILSRDMALLLLRCNRWGKSGGRRYWGRRIWLVGPQRGFHFLLKHCVVWAAMGLHYFSLFISSLFFVFFLFYIFICWSS
jgi:hypothetical protein